MAGNGFNPAFLGPNFTIPFPVLEELAARQALENGKLYHYRHYTVVMNKETRLAIYSACNYDAKNYFHISGSAGREYHKDERISLEYQADNRFYDDNDYDRGHLTRRTDVCWGLGNPQEQEDEAKNAEKDSNCWTNISPQHKIFHAEIWGKLEEAVRTQVDSIDGKQSIFTGPVHTENDKTICIGQDCVTVPVAYYKIIVTVIPGPSLRCFSFIIKQENWESGWGRNLHSLKSYQVSLSKLTELTNIRFDDALYVADPQNGPERDQTAILINRAEDIIV